MFYTRFAKKIICLFIVGILVLNPVAVRASGAGTLTVTGSGMGGAGAKETAALAIIMSVINSLGFTIHLSESARAAGQTASGWIKEKLEEWTRAQVQDPDTEVDTSNGIPVGVYWKGKYYGYMDLLANGGATSGGSNDNNNNDNNNNEENNNDGNKIGKNGKLYIGAGALYTIQKFLNWLNSRNEIINPELLTPSIVNGTYYGISCDAITTEGNTVTCTSYVNNQIAKVCWIKAKVGDYYKVCLYHEGNRFTVKTDFGFGSYSTAEVNGYGYATPGGTFSEITTTGLLDISELGWGDNFRGYLASLGSGSMIPDDNASQEDYIAGEYNSSDLNNPNDKYTEIDPGLLPQMTPQEGDTTINIEEYLKAIVESLNKKSDPQHETENVNGTDESTLENIPLEVPESDDYPSKFPKDQPEQDVEPPEDAEPVDNPEKDPDPGQVLPYITFDLREYFPFCLPFDCYDIVAKFVADPVAPSFDIPFNEPFSGAQTVIHVDLSPFDSMMVNVRNAELIAFVVGLALITRSMFAK